MSLFESTTSTLDSKKCKGCGETFYRKPTQVGKAERSWLIQEWCSKKCRLAHNLDDRRIWHKEYQLKNKDELSKKRKEYHIRKQEEDPLYKQKKAEYSKNWQATVGKKKKDENEKIYGYRGGKYYVENRETRLRKSREFYFNNKELYQNQKMLKAYGITLEKYNKMLLEQNGCCAICKKHADEVKNKRMILPLFIDHNHKTNKVRALLCLHCNSAIGFLREDVNVAKKVIEYLKEHNARV